MFRISGDFGHPNGFNMMIMQSQESTDNVIKSFEQYLNAGFGIEAALTQAYMENNVSENDLTDFDKERIKRKIENATNFGWSWRKCVVLFDKICYYRTNL